MLDRVAFYKIAKKLKREREMSEHLATVNRLREINRNLSVVPEEPKIKSRPLIKQIQKYTTGLVYFNSKLVNDKSK